LYPPDARPVRVTAVNVSKHENAHLEPNPGEHASLAQTASETKPEDVDETENGRVVEPANESPQSKPADF
jgi:hypothetical protein